MAKKPKKQETVELMDYRSLVHELRELRKKLHFDKNEEERIVDAMDVLWLRMTTWDHKMAYRQFGRMNK